MKYEAAYIAAGRSSVGIEFGSTRIKAVAVGEDFPVLATGVHDWKSSLDGRFWTYSLEDAAAGVRAAYAKLAADVFAAYAKAFEAALQANGANL